MEDVPSHRSRCGSEGTQPNVGRVFERRFQPNADVLLLGVLQQLLRHS